jgi:hypothetical protein
MPLRHRSAGAIETGEVASSGDLDLHIPKRVCPWRGWVHGVLYAARSVQPARSPCHQVSSRDDFPAEFSCGRRDFAHGAIDTECKAEKLVETLMPLSKCVAMLPKQNKSLSTREI